MSSLFDPPVATPADTVIGLRLRAVDWVALGSELDTRGYAVIPQLLDRAACAAMSASYDEDALFRSRVVMARHGYGRGEYRYFAYPLPDADYLGHVAAALRARGG